jgi:hypothetical protein
LVACIGSGQAERVQIIADWLSAHTAGPGCPHAKEPPELGSARLLHEIRESGAGQCLKQANQSISHATWPYAYKQPIITGLHALSLAGEGLAPGCKPVSAHTRTNHALML